MSGSQRPGRFDRVVVVDWSAASAPTTGRDSIWIGVAVRGGSAITSTNVATRAAAVDHVEALCADGRVLVGVDFSLGYPAGTAARLGLDEPAWSGMWRLLTDLLRDDDRNRNNRFEVAAALNARFGPGPGPFWGCPPTRRAATLTTTKVPPDPLPEWRLAELTLRDGGHRPFSCWQLLGAGSVGSQSLVGIARFSQLVARLRSAGRVVDVWPFTSGLRVPTADVVVAETWPTLVLGRVTSGPDRDREQVRGVADVLLAADVDGRLARWFVPQLATADDARVVDEEGWILGLH